MVRYHGCFANRSRFRDRLPPPPPGLEVEPTGETVGETDAARETVGETHAALEKAPDPEPEELLPPRPPRRTPWAQHLMRTLKVDGLDCPRCHARMVLLALITEPKVIERILRHLRLPHTPPPVAPPRSLEPPPPELALEPWGEPPEPDAPIEDNRARPPP